MVVVAPIDSRLARDVFPYKPTVITIMLGMNDGGYKAFDQKIFETHAAGFEHILDSLKANAPNSRITLIEPSPYDDATTRAALFEGGYNAVLLRYSDYLKTLAQTRHLDLADLNNPVTAMLRKAAETDKVQAQTILPDRVHPVAAGHLIMAAALLKAWHAPALVSDVIVDARAGTAQTNNAKITDIRGGAQPAWTATESALPLPIDLKDKLMELAVKSSDIVDSLDQELLQVTGLAAGKWELKIDGLVAGAFTSDDLAKGINLATLNTPMLKQALDVHALTLKHNNIHFTGWRTIQTGLASDASPYTKQNAMLALDQLDRELVAEQRAAAQPRAHRFELMPLPN